MKPGRTRHREGDGDGRPVGTRTIVLFRVQGLLLRRTEFCQQIGKLRSVLKTSEIWVSAG